ncbi:hypothetical protein ES705_29600 [subsurface metagenome]
MIVVQKYKENAERFKNLTSAVTFESCKKRLRLYFQNIGKCKAMLYAGKIIDIPFVTLQRDRRIRDIRVKDERRKKTSWLR